jgi:hypothetical protein
MKVCVKDGRVLKIVKNGVISELVDDNGDPYKIYYADRWACPECGLEILVTAPNAVAEHWEEAYSFYSTRIETQFSYNAV